VAVAVRFAREHDLRVSVRGGGHAVAGHGVVDRGLMIDLAALKAIRVDPGAGTARAAGGVLLGELDRATQRFGLAAPSGIVSHTGIGGLTLGGGLGHTMRKFGLTVDNLRSVSSTGCTRWARSCSAGRSSGPWPTPPRSSASCATSARRRPRTPTTRPTCSA
jgi:FAD/FMN-containing dehydrogenase